MQKEKNENEKNWKLKFGDLSVVWVIFTFWKMKRICSLILKLENFLLNWVVLLALEFKGKTQKVKNEMKCNQIEDYFEKFRHQFFEKFWNKFEESFFFFFLWFFRSDSRKRHFICFTSLIFVLSCKFLCMHSDPTGDNYLL